MPFDLNGEWAGIPKKIAIPALAIVAVGGYVFVKRYRAAKASNSQTNTPVGGATGSDALTGGSGSDYGPLPGMGSIVNILPDTTSQAAQSQLAATQTNNAVNTLAEIEAQQLAIGQGVASLVATNPGALAINQKLQASNVPIANPNNQFGVH